MAESIDIRELNANGIEKQSAFVDQPHGWGGSG